MKLYLMTAIAIAFSCPAAQDTFAQHNGNGCPTIRISCPDTPSADKKPQKYEAHLSGGDASAVTPTFTWTISAGRITAGQGTQEILVEHEGNSMTVTVDVGGYPPSCNTSASCSWIACALASPRKFDEYGDISLGEEQARLNDFAIQLENTASAQGFIMAYAGRQARAGEAQSRAERIRNYLIKERGIDPERIVTQDAGYRVELTIELYVVPVGASPPLATPTIDPSEVPD